MPRPGEPGGSSGAERAYTARMPFGVGPWELVILLGLLALLFGAKGVPDVAKKLGTGMRELKGAMGDVDPRRMLEPGDDGGTHTPPAAKPKPED
jgi:sec-independent protein translocase protein TatA